MSLRSSFKTRPVRRPIPAVVPLTSRRGVMAQPKEEAVKQIVLELVTEDLPIPIDSRLREELVNLMAAAIVAVQRPEGERSDDGESIGAQDHADPSWT